RRVREATGRAGALGDVGGARGAARVRRARARGGATRARLAVDVEGVLVGGVRGGGAGCALCRRARRVVDGRGAARGRGRGVARGDVDAERVGVEVRVRALSRVARVGRAGFGRTRAAAPLA